MIGQPEIQISLDELNQSELVLLARWCGIKASRGWPRNYLVSALETFEDPGVPEPGEKNRDKLSTWLNRLWDSGIRAQSQRKVCPNCHLCRELRTMSCYRLNRLSLEGHK